MLHWIQGFICRKRSGGTVNQGANTQGAEIETPKALREGKWGWVIPLPGRLGGLGERHKLPWCGSRVSKSSFGAF